MDVLELGEVPADDDEVHLALVLDVVLANRCPCGVDDSEAVRGAGARSERGLGGDEAVAVALDREAGQRARSPAAPLLCSLGQSRPRVRSPRPALPHARVADRRSDRASPRRSSRRRRPPPATPRSRRFESVGSSRADQLVLRSDHLKSSPSILRGGMRLHRSIPRGGMQHALRSTREDRSSA